jgi:hypothetical protein
MIVVLDVKVVIRNISEEVSDLIVWDVGVYVSVVLKYRAPAIDE